MSALRATSENFGFVDNLGGVLDLLVLHEHYPNETSVMPDHSAFSDRAEIVEREIEFVAQFFTQFTDV